MAFFDDRDIEIQDITDSEPEHFTGSVTTAGTPVVITPTNGRSIQFFRIINHSRGTYANTANDIIKYSLDGGTTYTELERPGFEALPGVVTSLYVDSNNNGVNYDIIVWS